MRMLLESEHPFIKNFHVFFLEDKDAFKNGGHVRVPP
jgi:hypothetical protein